MDQINIAWVAGLFDGEGCVLTRWPKKKRSNIRNKNGSQAVIRETYIGCRRQFNAAAKKRRIWKTNAVALAC